MSNQKEQDFIFENDIRNILNEKLCEKTVHFLMSQFPTYTQVNEKGIIDTYVKYEEVINILEKNKIHLSNGYKNIEKIRTYIETKNKYLVPMEDLILILSKNNSYDKIQIFVNKFKKYKIRDEYGKYQLAIDYREFVKILGKDNCNLEEKVVNFRNYVKEKKENLIQIKDLEKILKEDVDLKTVEQIISKLPILEVNGSKVVDYNEFIKYLKKMGCKSISSKIESVENFKKYLNEKQAKTLEQQKIEKFQKFVEAKRKELEKQQEMYDPKTMVSLNDIAVTLEEEFGKEKSAQILANVKKYHKKDNKNIYFVKYEELVEILKLNGIKLSESAQNIENFKKYIQLKNLVLLSDLVMVLKESFDEETIIKILGNIKKIKVYDKVSNSKRSAIDYREFIQVLVKLGYTNITSQISNIENFRLYLKQRKEKTINNTDTPIKKSSIPDDFGKNKIAVLKDSKEHVLNSLRNNYQIDTMLKQANEDMLLRERVKFEKEHVYSSWKVNLASGIEERYCLQCGKRETRVIEENVESAKKDESVTTWARLKKWLNKKKSILIEKKNELIEANNSRKKEEIYLTLETFARPNKRENYAWATAGSEDITEQYTIFYNVDTKILRGKDFTLNLARRK